MPRLSAVLLLAAHSAWNRRLVLGLVVACIALSTALLVSLERIRTDTRSAFHDAVSGTDLIVGPRTGAVQLLLYSVFRIGSPTQSMQWRSATALGEHPAVAWWVPLALGDSHLGYPVVATSADYFVRFRYANARALALRDGAVFSEPYEAVLGSDVAARLGYRVGSRMVLSHGDGALEENDHGDHPFTVSGVLRPTGTPVDRSVHIGMEGMRAIHAGWGLGMRPDVMGTASALPDEDPTLTAVLIGLKQRAAVFSVQRDVALLSSEALMAVIPAIALDELWNMVDTGEQALALVAVLVALVSTLGLAAVILTALDQRRRELAILRALGMGPAGVTSMLTIEGLLATLTGVIMGLVVHVAAAWSLREYVLERWGILLEPGLDATALAISAAVVALGVTVCLLPALQAYRVTLADGLNPRV